MRALVISKAFVNAMYRRKLRELAALGVDVVAVTPPEWIEGGAAQTLERGDGENYDVRVLPIRFNGHFHIHYYPGLSTLIREVRPDIVHVTSCDTLSPRIITVAKEMGIPVVVTLTDFWFLCMRHTLLKGDGTRCNGPENPWGCLRCLAHDAKVSLLGSARALLFPIQWEEPFGLVMIESMLTGTPVIAFPRGSAPEVVEEGITGFLARSVKLFREGAIKNVVHQCGFARARNPCNHRDDAQRESDVNILQIVFAGTQHGYSSAIIRLAALGAHVNAGPA